MNRRVDNRGKPVTAMLQMQEVHRDRTQVVELKKTSYLPYLFNLVLPKSFYQSSNRMVVARLYPDVHEHDKQAAEYFEGFHAPCFEMPASLFPGEVPMDKFVFMPTVMLPMGFEAGGIFGPGVLPRRSYPIDLMGHKGQTPPLFVGLRSQYVKLNSEVECFLDNAGDHPASHDAVDCGMHPCKHSPKQSKELMHSNNFSLSIAYNMPAPPTPPSPYPFRPVPVQYNIYTPDLSNVHMLMLRQRNLTVALLSTINHPHVPAVALATMGDEECPKFELPSDVFPICEGVNRPIFLPKRFLPKGFEAACVFKPASLSELWFVNYIGRYGTPQPQHNCAIPPPLFVGKYRRGSKAVNILKEIQLECERNLSQSAQSMEGASLQADEPKTPHFLITQGFMVLETEQQTPPKGAYCLESYQEASEKGCVVKVTKDEDTESADTQEKDELHPIKVETEPEDRGEAEDRKKYLSCFKVDSDIDLITEAIADMGSAEMRLLATEETLPGGDGARALDQLRQVLEGRSQIRSETDQLIQDHIYRMDRYRMLALRQPIRMCSGCGMLH
ncbi:DM7 family protein GE17493 [Drosophila santomea]|uniref:DM7 family protein GE17493 n=1 Tax=Drosophila santomea TaxID=129105 RepID=UPI001954EA84|nr:DM7 family protein GE17493 [Drosophila santomea]